MVVHACKPNSLYSGCGDRILGTQGQFRPGLHETLSQKITAVLGMRQ